MRWLALRPSACPACWLVTLHTDAGPLQQSPLLPTHRLMHTLAPPLPVRVPAAGQPERDVLTRKCSTCQRVSGASCRGVVQGVQWGSVWKDLMQITHETALAVKFTVWHSFFLCIWDLGRLRVSAATLPACPDPTHNTCSLITSCSS